MAADAIVYSSQRMDFLIITVSGAGIYVGLETIKYSFATHELPLIFLIKISGILFCFSIIINFISQITSRMGNHYDYLASSEKIEQSSPPTQEQIINIRHFESKANTYDNVTGKLNTASTILMLLGLSIIVCYFISIF